MLSNGMTIPNFRTCTVMRYFIMALLAVLTYEIITAPLHIMQNVNAEGHRKKERRKTNE